MNIQLWLTYLIVALASCYLLLGTFRLRKKSSCGGGCGCAKKPEPAANGDLISLGTNRLRRD